MDRVIRKEVIVPAPVTPVWQAWTTEDGVIGFFAPRARVELGIGGRYEMLFDLEAPVGSQGSEGVRVLSYLPEEMLSFDWSAPPEFPAVRRERTWVVVQLGPAEPESTVVRVTHLGWRDGRQWDQVYAYFQRAWDLVLERLRRRFAVGPIDWDAV